MGRRLNSTVHVLADDGAYHIYGPDDDVPAAHAKLIGDHAWASDADEDGVDSREPGTVPPRGGAGSGVEEWRSFARENGIDVADDESRDSVIAKCEAAGLVAGE